MLTASGPVAHHVDDGGDEMVRVSRDVDEERVVMILWFGGQLGERQTRTTVHRITTG